MRTDDLSADRRELFELRVQRWRPDLHDALSALYRAADAERLEHQILAAAAQAYAERDPALHRLDLERSLRPDWFQSPAMLGYAAYTDRLGPTVADLAAQLPYLSELGVTYLHLMPVLRPRDGDSDGGYAVADYRAVRGDLGTVDDLSQLAARLHERGISLVLDLVLNHVAYEHEWAARARAGERRYRDFFHVFPDRTQPDAFERTLPEVFPEFAPGNFTWDEDLAAWVWTTFNGFQWDVNWSNPAVFAEYAEIVLWLANLGVDVLRLDAIAFVWKRLGTSCQNQPEVHSVAQGLRALLRIAAPAVLLKAEAIVAPDDLVHYLGRGRHHGKVSDLAYHNTLMVQVWSMLASRDVRLAARALQELPPVPATTAWICYLRCHDDIGWAIDDGDAEAAGVTGPGHRAFLSDFYTGAFPGSFAEGLTFQYNPATNDRRVSGMTAGLAGLQSALRTDDRHTIDLAIRRILLAHAIVFGWGGIPVLWMGDELGLSNDDGWADQPGHDADNRWVHRPEMDERLQSERSVPGTVAHRLFHGIRHLARTRAGLPHLHASIPSQVLDPIDPGVLAVLRSHPEGELLELFNVTEVERTWPVERLHDLGIAGVVDRLAGRALDPGGGVLRLAPYQAMWLTRS
jgi:amylosucrase